MKLVSRFEAASLSTAELHGLLGQALLAFAVAPRSSQERRDVLESIRSIRERAGGSPARSLTLRLLPCECREAVRIPCVVQARIPRERRAQCADLH